MPVLVDLVAEPLDVLISLGAQRSGDHPPGALARERVERVQHLLVAPDARERDNIRHGVPSFSAFRRSVLNQPGRYAAFLLADVIHNIRL